jgi:hypothetical protein
MWRGCRGSFEFARSQIASSEHTRNGGRCEPVSWTCSFVHSPGIRSRQRSPRTSMATAKFVVPEDTDLLRPAIAPCRTDQSTGLPTSLQPPSLSAEQHHVSGAGSEHPQAQKRHTHVRSSRLKSRGTEQPFLSIAQHTPACAKLIWEERSLESF